MQKGCNPNAKSSKDVQNLTFSYWIHFIRDNNNDDAHWFYRPTPDNGIQKKNCEQKSEKFIDPIQPLLSDPFAMKSIWTTNLLTINSMFAISKYETALLPQTFNSNLNLYIFWSHKPDKQ